MPERHGAAHRISQTLPGEVPSPGIRKTRLMRGWDSKGWNISDPTMGAKTGGKATEHFDMSVWAGPAGHSAEVEPHHGGERYVAGPYRTQFRAQAAAESLTDRAATGRADRYQRR